MGLSSDEAYWMNSRGEGNCRVGRPLLQWSSRRKEGGSMTQQPGKGVVEFKEQAYTVDTQTPTITDEAIAAAQKLVGWDYRGARITVEVTRDAIRDFCNYMGSRNPPFLDEGYAP